MKYTNLATIFLAQFIFFSSIMGSTSIDDNSLPICVSVVAGNSVDDIGLRTDHRFESKSLAPINDLCSNPEEIVLDCFFQTVDGDNTGATPESFMGSSCDFDGDYIVWYSVELPTGVTGLEFQDLMAGFYIGVFGNDCDNLTLVGTIGGAPADCIEENTQILGLTSGTYLIGVGFENQNEGLFTFHIGTIVSSHDICDGATELPVAENCIWLELTSSNTGACPEVFTDPANDCFFDQSPVVWFQFTTDDDAFSGSFEIMGSGTPALVNPSFAVFRDTGCPDIPTAVDASSLCVTAPALLENLTLDPSTTYYIAVGSASSSEGEFTLRYKINATPENDDPCVNSDKGPINLTGGLSHSGSTCCARGFMDVNPDGSPADWGNIAPCSNYTSEASVWYMFTADEDVDGYEVSVISTTITNQMGVQVYASIDNQAGCIGFNTPDIMGSSCADLNATINFSNCEPNPVYFIKVTTTDNDCGGFTISIEPTVGCVATDNCEDATILVTQSPDDCGDSPTIQSTIGSLEMATPENMDNDLCGFNNNPTVWYRFEIDSPDATGLITQVTASGFDPVWAIFKGSSCEDLIQVTELDEGQTLSCSNSDGDVTNNFRTYVYASQTYWIAISSIGDINNPNFTLNYFTSLGCLSCSGEDASDCNNGNFEAFVNGVSSNGPFCPGEEVQICLDFTYDASETGNDWLHGIIPTFGKGWDIEGTDFGMVGGGFDWFDEDGPCGPKVNDRSTLPLLCTYTDPETGRLVLCNTGCNLSCPCTGPLEANSPLPSGWFSNSNGGTSGCNVDCSPSSFYGVSGGVFVTVDICFHIKVKDIADSECDDNKDLRISMQTFSDGVTGCWEEPVPCVLDPSMQSPPWEIACDTPPGLMVQQPWAICSTENVGLDITMEDNLTYQIQVVFEDNPNVEGEGTSNGWTNDTLLILGGVGMIEDMLTNNTDEEQTVLYKATVITSDYTCPIPEVIIEVIVLPDTPPTISITEEDLACGSSDYCFTVQAFYADGNPVESITISSCDGVELWSGTSVTGMYDPGCFDLSMDTCFVIAADSMIGCGAGLEITKSANTEELPDSDFKFFVSGNEVTFTYQGSEYTELRWEFGDGATSVEENPTHIYDTEGPFGASLFVTNPCGQDASTQTILIVTAGFNISQATSGCAPYMVTYMDASSINVDTWNWTFEGGDITTSTDQNPTVQYMTAGAYDVQLEVFATTGTDIRVMSDYIMVLDVPVPDFDTEVSERSVDLTYTGGAYDAISWDFGDGSTSTEENPAYTYIENGTYTIILTTTNECGSTAREHEVTVMSVGTVDIETLLFDLFPNPAKDYIVIETSVTSGNIEVVDVSGKLWMSTSISSELTLDTSHLPVGTYILKITDAHQVAAYKKLEIVR